MNLLKRYFPKLCRLFFGFFFIALAVVLTKLSHCLSPWNVLNDGLSQALHIPIGRASILVGALILLLDILIKSKFGVGTVLNITVIGIITDALFQLNSRLGLLSRVESVPAQLALCVLALFINGIGIYCYLSAQLGAGPRDALIISLTKRLPIPVAISKLSLEAAACLAGVLMGGELGVGTLLAVALGGPILQLVFRLFRFDTRQCQHESLQDTFHILFRR